MVKANHHLIMGGTYAEPQKASITADLISAVSDERRKQSFYRGVRYPGNLDAGGQGRMYPIYYIPPYIDNKKLQTVIPMSPKTHILSANSFELETVRILHLLSPDDPTVRAMVDGTLGRLKTTCFGYGGCTVGECLHAGLVALRFLAAMPEGVGWADRQLGPIKAVIGGRASARGRGAPARLMHYYWLCLSELPPRLAEL
ncbi:MAG: hypothetical protein FWE70_06125, partial [Oscillospiraceae bacterium]|nr:hypothetical protein [Oscillospiraceae bacterium]